MTLRLRQDQFIADMEMFDTWADRFNHFIALAEQLPPQCPEWLLPFRIKGCLSKTCFSAHLHHDVLQIKGWSNSPVTAGIIVAMTGIFNNSTSDQLRTTPIDFHLRSGLIHNLTPMRSAALNEMIRRINVL